MVYPVRDAGPEDVDYILDAFKRVNRLYVDLLPDFYRAVTQVAPKHELQVAVHPVGEHIARALNGPFTLKIAEDILINSPFAWEYPQKVERKPVGVAFARTSKRGARDWVKHDQWAYFDNIAVEPGTDFQAVGDALVASVKIWAKVYSLEAMQVTVAEPNEQERMLFERNGLETKRLDMWCEL